MKKRHYLYVAFIFSQNLRKYNSRVNIMCYIYTLGTILIYTPKYTLKNESSFCYKNSKILIYYVV